MMKYDGILPDMTRFQARVALVDEFVWALKHRPNDFRKSTHTIEDQKTGTEWWVSNGRYGMAPGNTPSRLTGAIEIGIIQRWRAWRAYIRWLKNHPVAQKKNTQHQDILNRVMLLRRANQPNGHGT